MKIITSRNATSWYSRLLEQLIIPNVTSNMNQTNCHQNRTNNNFIPDILKKFNSQFEQLQAKEKDTSLSYFIDDFVQLQIGFLRMHEFNYSMFTKNRA